MKCSTMKALSAPYFLKVTLLFSFASTYLYLGHPVLGQDVSMHVLVTQPGTQTPVLKAIYPGFNFITHTLRQIVKLGKRNQSV